MSRDPYVRLRYSDIYLRPLASNCLHLLHLHCLLHPLHCFGLVKQLFDSTGAGPSAGADFVPELTARLGLILIGYLAVELQAPPDFVPYSLQPRLLKLSLEPQARLRPRLERLNFTRAIIIASFLVNWPARLGFLVGPDLQRLPVVLFE